MNSDDQLVTLLREVPLPQDPADRYGDVVGRRRAADGRRMKVVGAALTVVALVATVSVVTFHGASKPNLATLLSSTEAGTAHLTGTVGGDGQIAKFEGDIDFQHERFSMKTTFQGASMEIRTIGHDTWVKGFGLTAGLLPGGRTWLHANQGSVGSSLGEFNPGTVLATLKQKKATVSAHGTEVISGVSTTRYDVTLPASDKSSGPFGDEQGQVYIDDQGLVRRLSSVASDSGDGHKVSSVVDFSDFGKPVDIQPPPASEVAEQKDLSFGSSGVGTTGVSDEQRKVLCAQMSAKIAKDSRMSAEQRTQLLASVCGPATK